MLRPVVCHVLLLSALASAVLLGSPGPAVSQDRSPPDSKAALEAVTGRVMALLRAGKFSEAVRVAEQAARGAEALFGPDSVDTAVAYHNLGVALRRANRPKEAETALERAFAVYERQLPAVHEDTRNVIGELGALYVQTGRADVLAVIYDRQISRAGREGYGEHIGVAHMLANQGFVLRGLSQAEDSEAAFARAVAIYEANGEITSEAFLVTFEALLDRLTATKRIDEAEARARAIIAELTKRGASGAPFAVILNNRLSQVALDVGRNGDAKTFAEAALSLLEGHDVRLPAGRADPMIVTLNSLARAHRGLGEYVSAEQSYRRAMALLEARDDKANLGIVTDNLAVLLLQQGRLDEAEQHFRRSFALIETSLGREHPSTGRTAANLAALLVETNRPDEAEGLLRRALAIAENQPRQDPVALGIIHDNLAGALSASGKLDEVRQHHERALALFEGALPTLHPRLATARNNLGRHLLDIGDYAAAERELRTALSLAEEIYGAENFNIAVTAANLGEAYTATGRYAEARTLFKRALAALESVYGPSHDNLQLTLNAAGQLELANGDPAAARGFYERAVAIELRKRARVGIRGSGAGTHEAASRSFLGLLEALWTEGKESDLFDTARALEIAQWQSATPAATALAALGARAGAGSAELAALTRERQDLAAEWTAVDRRLTQLLSQTSRDQEQEARNRARLTAIDARVQDIDRELSTSFPRFHELSRPAALSVDGLRKLLAPNEVAVQFTVTDKVTHVFALTERDLRWYRAPIGARDLRSLVRNLRCGLDRAEWEFDAGKRCATLYGWDQAAAPPPGSPLAFDIIGAHNLYRILLKPVEDLLQGRDLLVVPSGPLTALPLQVLVVDPPAAVTGSGESNRFASDPDDFRTVSFLGRQNAVTVLPSLASLAPLRQFAKSSPGRLPYFGVGNPLLSGPDGTDLRAFDVPACQPEQQVAAAQDTSIADPILRKSRIVRPRAAARSVDLDNLRRQWPLPETADELCRVAGYLGASGADVLLGSDATESRIKALSEEGRLANARVIHFATHGLLANETAMLFADQSEPALLLSPPAAASDLDDGLLTSSDIAGLKLDADWVVLSACNTAGGDDVGAEALSGLARAFFYAGARSLLVSHWAVDSDATVRLITAAFDAMARDPSLTHAQALSRAMAGLIDGGGRDAHPANWSPFVVVGGSLPVVR